MITCPKPGAPLPPKAKPSMTPAHPAGPWERGERAGGGGRRSERKAPLTLQPQPPPRGPPQMGQPHSEKLTTPHTSTPHPTNPQAPQIPFPTPLPPSSRLTANSIQRQTPTVCRRPPPLSQAQGQQQGQPLPPEAQAPVSTGPVGLLDRPGLCGQGCKMGLLAGAWQQTP